MKKKYALSAIYLLGWLYPLSILIFNIADHYLKIKEPYACPFDFNCDAMMGWVFYGLLILLVTFLFFFVSAIVKFRVSKAFYFSILNLLPALFILGFGWTYPYNESLSLNLAFLILSVTVTALTIFSLFKAEKKTA